MFSYEILGELRFYFFLADESNVRTKREVEPPKELALSADNFLVEAAVAATAGGQHSNATPHPLAVGQTSKNSDLVAHHLARSLQQEFAYVKPLFESSADIVVRLFFRLMLYQILHYQCIVCL